MESEEMELEWDFHLFFFQWVMFGFAVPAWLSVGFEISAQWVFSLPDIQADLLAGFEECEARSSTPQQSALYTDLSAKK